MRIILEDDNKLITLKLPKEIGGNYWLKNKFKDNLLNITGQSNKWIINSNIDVKILKENTIKNDLSNINYLKSLELNNYTFFSIYEEKNKKIKNIYCLPTYENMNQYTFDFAKNKEIIIDNKNSHINYELLDSKLIIKYNDENILISNESKNIPMFINNIKENEKVIYNGDVIFINGLVLTIIGNILLVNNPNNLVNVDTLKLIKRILPNNFDKDYSTEQESFIEAFKKEEYFQRPPRFKRSIELKEYKIDPPTGGINNNDEMPLVYTLGPMILMGTTSLMSGFTAVMNVISGKSTFSKNSTSIITSITMLLSMIGFPFLQRLWTKTNKLKKERKRKKKYKNYIAEKKEEILQEIEIQKQILIENNLDINGIIQIILNKQRNLWDRKLEHKDFLNIRLGIGSEKPLIKINIPEEHFSVDEDSLKDVYMELFESIKDIENVPVTTNLVEKQITGIVGNYSFIKKYLNGFMLQILGNHSYDMLKVVIFTSDAKKSTWEKYRNIPHFWNNEKNIRFIGVETDDINKISNYLIQILNERIDKQKESETETEEKIYTKFKDYYLIISDEVELIKGTSIFTEIIKQKDNYGFSLLLITEQLDKLPNECTKFINIEENNCGIFETDLISTKQRIFKPDLTDINLENCYIQLSNIPIDIESGKFILPKNYSFLEMFDVGNVNQLNISNRWKNNNIIQSLSTPVGINEQGDLFKIDLHEKAHGPHGLVAGMTGSGKSEWIITYILSMCINYHPDEVQFVLIDYKGGGLAGTFENKETGIKIPHLVGTITNLDVSEINRSLASINSELKRRQKLFNQARDKLGESSVDIYKYQKWYREGKINEPISHLFIISDEFAELKSQQPEFMQELISTARIGRSLGVHLILATQKPSGVVDEQIWSNSKFRVCLKVQDKSDSNDMIKCPDAALLKETGRFYLQVGFNEFFAKGQSAYAGNSYYESDQHKKTVDTNIEFLNNIGEVYKDVNSEKKIVSAIYKGEELPNVLQEIIRVGNESDLHVKQLWLDKIAPNIYIDELIKKYSYKKENYVLNPIIGEYDAPKYQKQGLLTLPISKNGNLLIYGMSGSGKEKLLSTILYSLSITHYFYEVNTYILDFGAEILNCFKKSPIIGEIINSSEEEKIKNYFNFIIEEFEKRKELFQEYNGDYYYYLNKAKKSLPIILNIINNFENFTEIFQDKYLNILNKITREGEKYGIIFIITVNNSNGINYRLSQNFKQNICLKMKDIYDYKEILATNSSLIPADYKGRGIVKINKECFEFQTADPTRSDDLNDYINNLSEKLFENQKGKAKSIKTIPKVVNYQFIKDEYKDLIDLPIGIETESLEICKFNFLDKYFNIITSNDSEILIPFINSLVNLINIKSESFKTIIFDENNYFDSVKENTTYLNNNYEAALINFNQFLDNIKETTKKTLIIFTGLNKIVVNNNIEKILNEIFSKISNIDKFNIIVCDEINEINKLVKENYINNYVTNDGIFIGSGIDLQYVLNIKKITIDMRSEIPNNIGYIVKKGKATKFKIIEDIKDDN